MGLLSKFEGKMEDTVEGAANKMGGTPLSPVQIAKRAEKQMRRERMVGAGKEYAPTLYTVFVNADDDARLFGYYPTLAGETETYLAAKAAEHGLIMDGQPLVRFMVDDELKHGKFTIQSEMVAAPLVAKLRQEEMERYGLGGASAMPMAAPAPAPGYVPPRPNGANPYGEQPAYDGLDGTENFQMGTGPQSNLGQLTPYLYDITHDQAFLLDADTMTIGRENNNDIVLQDINISRHHAEIRNMGNNHWTLTDLGSMNGTFVNGRKIKSIALNDADRITLGITDIEFQLI